MTLTEVKEVAPGYLSVEAIQKLLHFFPSLLLSLITFFVSFWAMCYTLCSKGQTVIMCLCVFRFPCVLACACVCLGVSLCVGVCLCWLVRV